MVSQLALIISESDQGSLFADQKMKSFAFLTTVFAFNITEPKSLRGRKQETSAEFIDRLLVGYDSNVHPNYYSKKPTNISVNIYINSIDSVESSTMDYKGITVRC